MEQIKDIHTRNAVKEKNRSAFVDMSITV